MTCSIIWHLTPIIQTNTGGDRVSVAPVKQARQAHPKKLALSAEEAEPSQPRFERDRSKRED